MSWPEPTAPVPDPSRRAWLGAALACGAAPAFVRHARAADQPRFALGVASGFPRPDGMVLWTMLTGPGLAERESVRWELAADEGFARIVAQGTEVAEAAWGHSLHVEPRGLEPGRWYWYRFSALGDRSAVGRTRSAPAPDAAATLDLAIASCQRYDTGHWAAWRQVAAESLDLVLFLGDYIYEYPSAPDALRRLEGSEVRTLAQYRARYASYKADPLLQAAHAASPWLCIWDDHEVENDYAGLQSQQLDPDFRARRAAAYQASWEHLPYPMAARPVGPDARIYGAFDWGRLARILAVDGRQYRDPQACPKPGRGGGNTVTAAACAALAEPQRSLLGQTQERWLDQAWDRERPWNLLAQTTLMAPFSWSDPTGPEGGTWWTEGWDGYPAARQRLLSRIAELKLGGAVVLGGDIHAFAVANLHRNPLDVRSPIVATEFCSGSISSLGMAQSKLDAALPRNPHILLDRADRRGYTRLTLNAQGLQARLMAVDKPADPASPVSELARFAVEAGRPGAQRL